MLCLEESAQTVQVMVGVEDKAIITAWEYTGRPSTLTQNSKTKFNVSSNKKLDDGSGLYVEAMNESTQIKYAGANKSQNNMDHTYLIGVKNKNRILCYPTSLFAMKPILKNDESKYESSIIELSKKEQMDEMNKRFGSKRTINLLENKRKYAISIDDDDLPNVKQAAKSMNVVSLEQSASVATIMPYQNNSAIKISEVYNLNDIVTDLEYICIETSTNIDWGNVETVKKSLHNDYVKQLIQTNSTKRENIAAKYLDAGILLLNLKAIDLRKKDPLPTLTNEDVKRIVFEKYTQDHVTGKLKRKNIDQKSKDKLMVHCIILSFIINHFRQIEFNVMSKALKMSANQLKKISMVVGCHLENRKNTLNINSKYLELKLPLYKLNENPRKKKLSI